MTERENIIATHRKRLQARETLRADIDDAKTELNPKVKMDRWVADRKTKARSVAAKTGTIARRNAPLIGAAGLGALVFFNRRIISGWLSHLKKRTSTIED